MTILDLIRKLHKEGTVIKEYELYTTGDRILLRDAVYSPGVNPNILRQLPNKVNPGSVELGEDPEYLVCHDADEYEEHTGEERPNYVFPRLLVCVSVETVVEFDKRWRGHHWTEIPPLEIYWSQFSFSETLPLISKDGVLIGYESTSPFLRSKSYYILRSKYGDYFAWAGDLTKDTLPDGMTLDNSGKFLLE